MCGIAGYIGRQPLGEAPVRETLERMKRRGPDHQAAVRLKLGDATVCLLHSRLSIIDLEGRSDQPFQIGDHTIVFNGEIYNYVELRKELEAAGEIFSTQSDTEVLLRSYIRAGAACVEKMEGM